MHIQMVSFFPMETFLGILRAPEMDLVLSMDRESYVVSAYTPCPHCSVFLDTDPFFFKCSSHGTEVFFKLIVWKMKQHVDLLLKNW